MEEARTNETAGHEPPYTVREIAQKLRVSPKTVYAEIALGALAALKIGETFRVERDDFEAYRKQCRRRAVRPTPETEAA